SGREKTKNLEVSLNSISKRTTEIEIRNLINDFRQNMREIDLSILNKNYTAALHKTIDCLKEHPVNGDNKTIYSEYSSRLLRIIRAVKRIQLQTKATIEENYPLLSESDKRSIEEAINALPIYTKDVPKTV